MDKIKNFLYDISDMILSLVIIALIFYAVSWKISDTLSPDTDVSANKPPIAKTDATDKPSETTTPKPEDTNTVPTTPSTDAEGTDTIGTGTDAEGTGTTTPPTGTDKTTETTDKPETDKTTTETPKDTSKETPTGELVVFTVESGATGYSIGKALEQKGFISNANDFTKRIIEQGVDNKLKAGDFKLANGDSLDTIINVLIGKGR